MNLVMNYIGFMIMENMQVIAEGTNWDMTKIKKKARVNVKGKPGKSRRGILTIFAHTITTEKVSTLKGDRFCQPCGSSESNVGHWKAEHHKQNVVLAALQDITMGNMRITSKEAGVNIKENRVNVTKGNEAKNVLLYVTTDIDKVTGVTTPCRCNEVVIEGEVVTTKVINVDESDEEDRTENTTEVRVLVTCKSDREIFPVVLVCQGDRRFKFLVSINCEDYSVVGQTVSQEPNREKLGMDRIARSKGKALIKESKLEYARSLKEFKSDVENKNNLSADQTKDLTEGLTVQNYEKKFRLLLSMEYLEQIETLENSDIKDCKVRPTGEYSFRVEEENLNVGDQKLRAGDSIKISCNNIIYEANVVQAYSTHTDMITKSLELMDKLTLEDQWNLHFLLNNHTFSLQARALDMLNNTSCVPRLFPVEGTQSVFEGPIEKIEFINEAVAKNREQACAVLNIVNRSSGTAPVN